MNLQEIKDKASHFEDESDKKVSEYLITGVKQSVLIIETLLNYIKNDGYTLDKGGHYLSGMNPKDDEDFICRMIYDVLYADSDYKNLVDNDVVIFSKICHDPCWKCAENGFSLKLDKKQKSIKLVSCNYDYSIPRNQPGRLIIKDTECKYKDGCPEYSIRLNIPSGKMLFANHFKNLFDFTELPEFKDKAYSDEFSINFFEGKKRCTEEYAKLGLAEFNIGNCACDMFKVKNGEFFVGAYFEDDENNHEDIFSKVKQVGDVCTGFWGFCIVDKDTFEAKVGKEDLSNPKRSQGMQWIDSKILDDTINVIKCTPGVYEFTHRYHLLKEDEPRIYTTIKLIEKL